MDKKVLGKGLSALIPERLKNQEGGEILAGTTFVKTELVQDNSQQPRTRYDDAKIAELMASIKEKGVLQPLLVREKDGKYEVIAGERRLKAVRNLGMEELPVVIRNVSDSEALVLALIENIQREELNAIEEANAFQRLITDFQLTHEQIAEAVGKDRSTISNTMRLLKLPEEVQNVVVSGQLSMGHARSLVGIESATKQKELFDLVMQKGLSVRELESIIKAGGHGVGKPKKAKKTPDRDHEIVRLEEELQQLFGTKVRIQASQKRGKIVLEYYSLDDLDRILNIIRHENG